MIPQVFVFVFLNNSLRWLILCVSLVPARISQIPGQTLFLDVSLKVFLEETSIWIGRLSKADCPPQVDEHQLIHWGSGRRKCGGKQDFIWLLDTVTAWLSSWDKGLLLPLPGNCTFSDPDSQVFRLTPCLLVLRPFDADWTYTTSFPGSPVCRHQSGISQHPQLFKPFLYNKSLYLFTSLYMYILFILFLWRILLVVHNSLFTFLFLYIIYWLPALANEHLPFFLSHTMEHANTFSVVMIIW